jgi:DNA-binding transcriptional MocR family regulator
LYSTKVIPETAALARVVTDRSARGIAAAVGRMVSGGELKTGARLPTVRALAAALGVSPMTVSEAWQLLIGDGLVETRGRGGTWIVDGARTTGGFGSRRRTAATAAAVGWDLSTGVPDPALLPDLGPSLGRVGRRALTTSYLAEAVVPQLEELLRARWPFTPEAMTVVDGAGDALDRIVSLTLRRGDRVAVEDPTYPPLLDLLAGVGAEVIGLELDAHGIRPAALAAAVKLGPVALYLQPRAHNPTGVSMTPSRAARLARVLQPTGMLVVEDDHAGDIAVSPPVSLGAHLPDRTVHIRSFSKSHGPDLRLAAVGGAATVIRALEHRRRLGSGWSSRLLQHVLVELLTDEATTASVAAARASYASRREAAVGALRDRGVAVGGQDGINIWVPVADETHATLTLAAAGIGVAPGAPFSVSTTTPNHVRVTAGLVAAGADRLADALADAARTPEQRLAR